jgi:hypothetical protein
MKNEKEELSQEELALAQDAWFSSDRYTSIISATFGLILSTRAESWIPWVEAHDLGIPYSMGVEMGDIKEDGLTPKGTLVIEATYESLCAKLGVESISSVRELHNLMINSGRDLPEEEVEEEVED